MRNLHFFFYVLVPALVAGCVSPRATAYKTLASIQYAVDGAMKAEAMAYVQGKVGQETHDRIAKMHDIEYAPAFTQAVLAAKMDYATAPPEEVALLAANLINIIDGIVHPKPKGSSP